MARISIWLILFFIYHASSVMSQDLFYLKARAFDEQRKYDSALFYYNKHIEKKSQDWNACIHRGNLYFRLDSTQKALNDFFKAEKLKKNVASFELARLYAQVKDTLKTLYCLENHLGSIYKRSASQIRMEPGFSFLEHTDGWKKLWQKNWYNRLDEQVGEAEYLAKAGDWMTLINFVNDLSDDGNLRSDLLFLRAKAYSMMDNREMALKDLKKLLETNKRNSEYFEFRADLFFLQKDFKAAEADLNKAIDLKSDQFSLYKKRAKCRLENKLFETALLDIRLFLELFPDDREGKILSVKIHAAADLHLQALTMINQLLTRDSLNASLYLLRADIYDRAGMELQAGKDYNYSLKLFPSNSEALLARGKYLLKSGNPKAACPDLRKAEKAGNMEAGRLVFENCPR